MKILVLVNTVDSVPEKIQSDLVIVSPNSFQDVNDYIRSRSNPNSIVYLFLNDSVNFEYFLKLIEDFKGSLVVYTTSLTNEVFLSRFTKVVNRRKASFVELAVNSVFEDKLNNLKKVMYGSSRL